MLWHMSAPAYSLNWPITMATIVVLEQAEYGTNDFAKLFFLPQVYNNNNNNAINIKYVNMNGIGALNCPFVHCGRSQHLRQL